MRVCLPLAANCRIEGVHRRRPVEPGRSLHSWSLQIEAPTVETCANMLAGDGESLSQLLRGLRASKEGGNGAVILTVPPLRPQLCFLCVRSSG